MSFQYLDDRGPWNRELLWDDKEGQKARYIVPPIMNLSNGPSGLTYNPGTGLSKKYAGKFYLSDFRGGAGASVVHEIALEPAGSTFKVKDRRDFVKGVLTTDVEFGTDGALYVLDWVESWSGVDKGRIFKFTAPDADTAKQAEVKKLLAEGMIARSATELENLLANDDQRVPRTRSPARQNPARRRSRAFMVCGASASSQSSSRMCSRPSRHCSMTRTPKSVRRPRVCSATAASRVRMTSSSRC
jgi:quinoprotein glucose dehydrogenase